jgi:hypothetical protein
MFVELNKKQVDAPSLVISHPSKMEATKYKVLQLFWCPRK